MRPDSVVRLTDLPAQGTLFRITDASATLWEWGEIYLPRHPFPGVNYCQSNSRLHLQRMRA
jgi:hypothetical protein